MSPKEAIEIKTFHAGIQASPDAHDLPIDAASYSENLEQLGEDGRLRGIPKDTRLVQYDKKGTDWAVSDYTGVYSISFTTGTTTDES
jgi:hypothetical protein|tara:strand:- start:5722 stop:5982 length:261 start_codon:yes stop_codon:yes gene_type:complete